MSEKLHKTIELLKDRPIDLGYGSKMFIKLTINGIKIIKNDIDEEKDNLEKDGDSVNQLKLFNFYNDLMSIDNSINIDFLNIQLFYDDGLQGEEKMRRKIDEDNIKSSILYKELNETKYILNNHLKLIDTLLKDDHYVNKSKINNYKIRLNTTITKIYNIIDKLNYVTTDVNDINIIDNYIVDLDYINL